MAKRFTDNQKWERPWFRKLPLHHKILWNYICDKCDEVGVWYPDFDLASYFIGHPFDEKECLQVFEKQVNLLPDGRWFLKDFIAFQYGSLTPNNNFHRSLLAKLSKINSGADQPLTCPSSGAQEKERVKERVKDISSSPLLIPEDLMENEKEIHDWLEYKKQKGQTYKPKGLEALWRCIRKIPKENRRASIDQSMSNNWAGLFEANKTGGSNGNSKDVGFATAVKGKYPD